MSLEHIRHAVVALTGLDSEADSFAALYGSRSTGRDIDILVVQPRPVPSPVVVVGRLDLLVLQRDCFDQLLSLLDPMVVEPVITGDLLFGDEKIWIGWREQVAAEKNREAVVNHLSERSVTEIMSARQILSSHSEEGASWAFQNLSFSIAYASFARWYSKPDSAPCTLEDLIRNKEVCLPSFWRFRSQVKAGAPLSHASVEEWFAQWSRCLVIQS